MRRRRDRAARSEPAPTARQPITTPVDTAAEGVSDSNPAAQPAATDSTVEATTPPPIEEPLEVEQIAILDPAAGFGPAETLSEADLWLGAGTGDDRQYAIRRTQTDDPVTLNWSLLADSEWSKTYSDQPDVELPDGRIAKRLIPTLVDVVNYAIQTDDGVFSAAITPVAEAELAQWFSEVAGTDIDTITPPDGYQPVADETGTRLAIYADQTTLYTTTFDDSIEFADYIATRFTGFSLEPIGDQGAFVATAPNENIGLQNNTVIWQPQPDIIVTASGPPEELTPIADALTLTDLAAADLSIRNNNPDPNITGEPDITVLDETSEGRFAYTQTTQPDGTICSTFFHNAHGGGGRCQEDPTTSQSPRSVGAAGHRPTKHQRACSYSQMSLPTSSSKSTAGHSTRTSRPAPPTESHGRSHGCARTAEQATTPQSKSPSISRDAENAPGPQGPHDCSQTDPDVERADSFKTLAGQFVGETTDLTSQQTAHINGHRRHPRPIRSARMRLGRCSRMCDRCAYLKRLSRSR